jgi:DNA-directed RNA polymerase specialized sigma24 family protein
MKTEVISSEAPVRNLYQDLIDKCNEGDQRAQFQIYRLYNKAMYNISLRIINNPHEAEEIMKESLLSAFENISTYTGNISFDTWLKNIVINRSLEVIRKERTTILENVDYL